jgi:CBS domain-containing protein
MRVRNVGILPVVDGDKLIGILMDRDIVLRAVSERLRPEMARVRDVMTRKLISCFDDQDITEASLIMERNLVHRLIVFDRNKKLVGIVSISDLAAKAKSEALSGHSREGRGCVSRAS